MCALRLQDPEVERLRNLSSWPWSDWSPPPSWSPPEQIDVGSSSGLMLSGVPLGSIGATIQEADHDGSSGEESGELIEVSAELGGA